MKWFSWVVAWASLTFVLLAARGLGAEAPTAAPAAAPAFLVGGPLAGVALPPYPTQHGERPGYPGWFDPASNADDLFPELELYPGAIEHFRAYWFKYCPVRSNFDRQSQVRNWVAPKLPGAAPADATEYAAPVYRCLRHANWEKTDKTLAPVPVVRCRVGAPVLTLDLGELPRGLYALRVIGAVPTEHLRPFSRALFLKATINDTAPAQSSSYRQRVGYCDEFYSVAEFYFHAAEPRRYQATLQVDTGSEVELLVHNITLDDALAGTTRKALKTRAIRQLNPGVTPAAPKLTGADRRARDAALWQDFPRLNYQGGEFQEGAYGKIPGVLPGTDKLTPKEIVEQFGDWTHTREPGLLMVNAKLKLQYSMADFATQKPLPEPYPFKDDGCGLTFPTPDKPAEGRVWAPVAAAAERRVRAYMQDFGKDAAAWVEKGDRDAAHDGAMRLVRFAYAFPAIEDVSMLTAIVHDPSAFGRGHRTRSRDVTGDQALGHFGFQFGLHHAYDALYTYIAGNEDLAQSVGRFVPWVKTPRDVIELLDVYLLQTHAKRHLRYQYYGDGREPAMISEIAAVLGDQTVTNPWLEWLFSRTYYYPRPLAGIADYLVCVTDRDGRSTIGSSSYVMGDESASATAKALDFYVSNGGNPAYNLRDFVRFPKAVTALSFPLRAHTAGLWTMRMGSVSGPDKGYAKAWSSVVGEEGAVLGWRWTRDPAFAYTLKHFGKREEWPADEWAAIEQAAAGVARAPWLTQRSRMLVNYAAFLESGVQHDDLRFRRSVQIRLGTGSGHSHGDTLDLLLNAHGLPMAVDAGQRPGYSTPPDWMTRVHNTVEVNGQDWPSGNNGGAGSWLSALSDTDGARYLHAHVAPNGLARGARQVALIDVDEGRGSQPLGPEGIGPAPKNLPKDIVTPNSYVFDVFRVAGGNAHTYCFHANVNDLPTPELNPQPVTNARDVQPVTDPQSPAGQYLQKFANEKYAGTAPERFEATFRLQKERIGPRPARMGGSVGVVRAGTESYFAPFCYDPQSPDKFTRLHLFNAAGGEVMKGDLNCTQWGYFIPMLFVRRSGPELQSAFAAIIEPYAGTPFIREVRQVAIADNAPGAAQAVALAVTTVNGHSDLCFADGTPGQERQVGDARIAAEFAYVSTDALGLRQLTLTGGTVLDTPSGALRLPAAEYRGQIVAVDYRARKVWVDAAWPAGRGDRLLELKTRPADDPAAWATGLTSVARQPDGGRTELTFSHSVDFYRAVITAVDEAQGRVTGTLGLPLQAAGFRCGWTATNDAGTKTWTVSAAGDGFTLAGSPVRAADFAPEHVLRLWEYGVGDSLRLRAAAALRRVDDGVYELTADGDVTVALKVTAIEFSRDRQQWRPLTGQRAGALLACAVSAAELAPTGTAFLRVK